MHRHTMKTAITVLSMLCGRGLEKSDVSHRKSRQLKCVTAAIKGSVHPIKKDKDIR